MEPLHLQIPDKTLHQLSEEELTELLKTATPGNFDKLGPILDFINRFEIKSGRQKISLHFFYTVFLKYYPKTHTKAKFAAEVSQYIKTYRSCYYVNKEFYDTHKTITKPTPSQKKKTDYRQHFLTFLEAKSISKGTFKVPMNALYHIYREYCIDNRKTMMKREDFFIYLNLFFTFKPSNEYIRLYEVDKETSLLIPNKDYIEIEKIYKKTYKKK